VYFQNTKFDDYSLVGVSVDQVDDYLKWRTNYFRIP